MGGPFSVFGKRGADDMRDVEALEVELRDLLEQLRPGGSQAFCEGLRAQINAVHSELAAAKRSHANDLTDDRFQDD